MSEGSGPEGGGAPRRGRATWWTWALGIALSGGLLYWLVGQIGVGALVESLRSIEGGWFAVMFGVYLGTYVARAVRYRRLLRGRISVVGLMWVSMVHTWLAYVIPGKAGEFSLIVLLSRWRGVSVGGAGKTLVAARALDVAALFGMGTVALLTVPKVYAALRSGALLTGLCAAAGVLILLAPELFGRATRWALDRVTGVLGLARDGRMGKVYATVDEMTSVRDPGAFRRELPALTLWTVAIWGFQAGSTWLRYRAMGVCFGALELFYLMSLANIVGQVPLQGVAGLGSADAVGAGLLLGLGWETHQAITVTMGTHAQLIAVNTLAGLLGLVAMWLIGSGGRGPEEAGSSGSEPNGESAAEAQE